MLKGFYKVRFQVNDTVGHSVMYACDGRMLGGNSAFAHIGTFVEKGGVVTSTISIERHNADPNYTSLLGHDSASIDVRGSADGEIYRFTGGSKEMPNSFRSEMTPLDDTASPASDAVGEGGISNGLYSIHIRMLDGIDGGLTGVMLLSDGRILGGDAYFYYVGTYTSANGRWKGEILHQEHTPAQGVHSLFSGHQVGIGFSGSCDAHGAELEATALAGKRSVRFYAALKLMRRA